MALAPLIQRAVLALVLIHGLAGCAPSIPRAALQLQPESLALRQLQTRRFDTKDEKFLIVSGASLLQDMGFQIEDSETSLGVLVGSKDADARDAKEITSSILVAALLGADIPWANNQKIRASLVTRPLNRDQVTLRVTFQRTVWDNKGQIHRIEGLTDPMLYRDFFDKLSKAVFLEANQI